MDKVVGLDQLIDRVRLWRSAGEKIVFTNGVFDILHRGHLHSLEKAAEFGDRLVVGVNSDRSARLLNKGEGRPFNGESDRAVLLAGLEIVDAVTIFDEPTPIVVIMAIRPDVLVKGEDYQLQDIVGREFAGRVERIGLLNGYSTSSLAAKIRNSGIV